MGYFKTKLRRSAAAVSADRFLDGCDVDWDHASIAERPPAAGFVRLATDEGASGVFQAAYALRRRAGLSSAARSELDELLGWFERELRPHSPAEPAAVFWFKAGAATHIGRIWRLVRLLQRAGSDVRMWTTRRPGRVVFEDAFQVAAVPQRDRRPTAKQLPRA